MRKLSERVFQLTPTERTECTFISGIKMSIQKRHDQPGVEVTLFLKKNEEERIFISSEEDAQKLEGMRQELPYSDKEAFDAFVSHYILEEDVEKRNAEAKETRFTRAQNSEVTTRIKRVNWIIQPALSVLIPISIIGLFIWYPSWRVSSLESGERSMSAEESRTYEEAMRTCAQLSAGVSAG